MIIVSNNQHSKKTNFTTDYSPLFYEDVNNIIYNVASDIVKIFSTKRHTILASLPELEWPVLSSRIEDLLTSVRNDITRRAITDIFFAAYEKAENQCPSSGILAVYTLAKLIVDKKSFPEFEENHSSIVKNLRKIAQTIKKDNFFDTVANFSNTPSGKDTTEIVANACLLAGLEGRITTSMDNYSIPTISLREGHNFNVKLVNQHFRKFAGNIVSNPKLLFYDGSIQHSSELHLILFHASRSKTPIFIFAHRFTEGVLFDLYKNMQRGAIKVFPVEIKRDLTTLNTLSDMCFVSGGKLISPHFGDNLSSCGEEALVTIDKIKIYDEEMVLVSNMSKNVIKNKIEALEESTYMQSSMSEFDELEAARKETLLSRVKSLTFRTVEISIPSFGKTQVELQKVFNDIDKELKLAKTVIINGIVEKKDLKDLNNDILNICIDFLNIHYKRNTANIPFQYIKAAIDSALSNFNLLNNVAACLVMQNKNNEELTIE